MPLIRMIETFYFYFFYLGLEMERNITAGKGDYSPCKYEAVVFYKKLDCLH